MQEFSVALLGSGGAGVVTVGQLLLTLAARQGFYGLMNRSYGPQIRGGESAALLRLALSPVCGPPDKYDLILALDWRNAERFAEEIPLTADTTVVYDEAAGEPPEFITKSRNHHTLPMSAAVKAIGGGRSNAYALGWLAQWIDSEFDAVATLLAERFGARGEEAVEAATAAARAGYEAPIEIVDAIHIKPEKPSDRWLISGNEAAGFGALQGGVRFVAAYPITPASDMLEYLAARISKLGGVMLQAEDEIASINAVIGASWGGVPALTATSGPGLALMTEALGLAVASETSLVVVDVQRVGPSTGIPTKSEQTDLNIALHGLHGDAPHLVLAPNGIGDSALTTQWSVHLSETLQAPAIVLSDQFLAQTTAIIDRPAPVDFMTRRLTAQPEEEPAYLRYAVTADGLSPVALPGQAHGMHTVDGLEHEPGGRPSSSASNHYEQLAKRQRKLDTFDYGQLACHTKGTGNIALLCWGSAYGACNCARRRLEMAGRDIRVIAPRLLAPLPVEEIGKALEGVSQVLVVEQSHSGQFFEYLRAKIDGFDAELMARPGPRPIRPMEIVERVVAMEKKQ